MLQLVYISSAKAPVSGAVLDNILAVSRRNNAAVGVSGLLVAGGRRFLQALEGPEQAVLATYARIQADHRHRALVLLSRRQVDERGFGDWSMAYEEGDTPGDDDLRTIIQSLTVRLKDQNLRAQFTGFAEIHARAA